MGKENYLSHAPEGGLYTVDHESGNPIRKTDNGLKECDLPGVNQSSKPLELGKNGLPVGWKPPRR